MHKNSLTMLEFHNMSIEKILLATKMDSSAARNMAQEIMAWLEQRNCSACTACFPYEKDMEDLPWSNPDLILVLGGDGTMLSVVRTLLDLQVSFLGVNLGKVGFLAEVSPLTWKEQLSMVLKSGGRISRRMLLEYSIFRAGSKRDSGVAINELVVSRGELARIISLDLESSQGAMESIRADGLIVSTPTGSTAYCVSAGGPLVHPEMQAMILTPVCVFLHDFKPLVMPASESLLLRIGNSTQEAYLTVDGQTGFVLKPGDELRVKRYHADLQLLMCRDEGFINKLRYKKFFIRG